MVARSLRVGLIGAGDMSRHHLEAWRQTRGAQVVAIVNRTIERAQARASEFDIPSVYTDARQMLTKEGLDAVDIVTTRETHAEFVLLATEFGVDAMCQKPLAPSLREAEALVEAVGDRIRLMVHENRRFAPHYRLIRDWITDGKIGEIRQGVMTTYRSSMLKGGDGLRPSVERASYFATERRLMIGEALIHQLDVLRFLLGPLRVVAARTLRTEPDIAGETVATVLLETVKTQAPITLAGSYVAPGFGQRSGVNAVGAQTSDRLDLAGSRSSVVLSDEAIELRGAFTDRETVDYPGTYQYCFTAAVAHFVERLRDGEPFETSAVDNLETLRLVEDAYRLASLGREAS